jgi:AMP-polyphosphate phosphotransferase
MLELIDVGQQIDKDVYDRLFPDLQLRLAELQRAARAAELPVLVIFEGWDAAGKGTMINDLAQVLDPRGFQVQVIVDADEGERLRPWLWRFWKALPAAGRIAIFDHSWYHELLEDSAEHRHEGRCQIAYQEVQQFERQLTDAGVVLVKFWLHISKEEQKRRLKRLDKNRATTWRVGKDEWRRHRHYDKWVAAVEDMFQRTSAPNAPWTIIEANQKRFARMRIFETIAAAIQGELDHRATAPKAEKKPMPEPAATATPRETVIDRLDLSVSLDRETYEKQLDDLQERLFELEHLIYRARLPAVIVYEGCDAAGKGGNIRRLTSGLDPRGYQVIPIAAPTAEERAHHYLWRFWRHVPKAGHIAIFDRSWYGRVLVERVEGFCTEAEWKRSFQEINEFERQLAEFGMVMVKFWLQIDADEQLRRFKERQETPEKEWKICEEDWRNRGKWKQYEVAVVEMLERTSTLLRPGPSSKPTANSTRGSKPSAR